MGTGKLLMLISETLAVVAVAAQFFLPERTGIGLTLAHRTVALPVRWVVPLLVISVAGVLGLTALFNTYWRLAHIPLSAGQ
jgi:hypothetical protein